MNGAAAGNPFAIVGIGCRFPGGANSPDQFWKLLYDGVDAIIEVPRERFDLDEVYDANPSRPGKMYTRWGGFTDGIDTFDAAFFGISPREAVRMDPQQRVLLEVVWEALEDGGLPAERLVGSNAGVFIGISTHDYSDLQLGYRDLLDSYYGTGTAMSIAANRISYAYDFRGPSIIVDTACSSSLTAVHLACRSLKSGECDLAIAGGVNLFVTPEPFIAFCKASMLSPDGRCMAFDSRANGFVRGEGAGVVVLKALDRAIADGDKIYALVRGSAVNQDGRTTGIAVPNAHAQEALIRQALDNAGAAPHAVQYVEAHGTGTRVGDPIEAGAIGRILSTGRSAASPCLIGSVKTNIGHLEAAAGIAGLVKTALALKHRTIPPSLHFRTANPSIPFEDLQLRVVTAIEPWPTNGTRALAGINAFGFGGANAHVVLEEPPPATAPPDAAAEGCVHILPISARHPNALRQLCGLYRDRLRSDALPLRDVCYTAAARRGHHAHRACLVGFTRNDMIEQLDALMAEEANPVLEGLGGQHPKLAFVFTGMGPQWWGMGRQLFRTEPRFRAVIEECDARFRRVGTWSLAAALAADETTSRVHEADLAPVANFAIQTGLVALWRSWGIVPDAIVGHSAGEIAAACAAGALTLEDALLVGFTRGRLQHRASGTGTMLSVGIPAAVAAEAIAGVADRVSIAAINSPTSVTLAGDRTTLEEIAADLTRQHRFNRFVPVEVPYHGPQMLAIRDEMLESLADLAPRAPSIPLLSTVTGTWLDSRVADASYWYDNVRKPVRFAAAIEQLIEQDFGLFVEVGPHPALAKSIVESLSTANKRGVVLPTLRRMEDERHVMLRSLAALYSRGRSVDWSGVYPTGELVAVPRYPWQRDRHWFTADEPIRTRAGVDSGHPLLGYRLRSVRPVWEADLADARLEYLADHIVQSSPMLPGAAYAEMAFGAARAMAPGTAAIVEDLAFRKALFLANQKNTLLQFLLDPETAAFEIHSGTGDADTGWTLHATGRLRTSAIESTVEDDLDLAAIRVRCATDGPVGELYELLDARGLRYRRDFLGIDALWRGSGDALVRIKLPNEARADAAPYCIHPALLDAAFQGMLAATQSARAAEISSQNRYLPASIKRLTFIRAPGPLFWCYAVVTRIDAEVIEGDVVITDEAGHVAVRVEGLRCKSLHEAARAGKASTDDALYQLAWEPQQLTRHASHEPAPVQNSVEVGRRLTPAAAHLADRLGWVGPFRKLEPTLDAIVARFTRAALIALGWNASEIDAAAEPLAEQLGVAARHRRLFARLMEILREVPLPPVTPLSAAAERADAELLCARVLSEFPENRAAVDLLRRSGERLDAILKDEVDAREVLFAPAAISAWGRFFGEVPWYQYYNRVVADAVAMAVENVPAETQVRVLEIGAGTGGTTASVLPRLANRAAEYHFTDVSTFFLAQARERFRDQPQVRVTSLDIETDPAAQPGHESFDVVIAANVLHATADLRVTLRNVKRLLRPGGLLVLLEVSRKMAWTDLIFGITDGWWRFVDTDVRPAYALMEAARWRTLLSESGFDGAVSVSEPRGEGEPVSAVIIASLPREVPAVASAGTAEQKHWLIYSDAAGLGEQLAIALRSRGDRAVSVRHGTESARVDAETFVIATSVDDSERVIETLSAEGFRHDGVIHTWSVDWRDTSPHAPDMVSAAQTGCGSLASLLQAFERSGRTLPPLWVVTSSAQLVEPATDTPRLTQAPIWGFARVLTSEYPRSRCRLVDLDPDASDVRALLDELDAPADYEFEEEVAYRGTRRYVTRLRPTRVSANAEVPRKRALSPDQHHFRLEIDTPGALESLSLREAPGGRPGPGEIEIRVLAAGLNFRDVMLALGLLPPMVIPGSGGKIGLGFECSGIVSACGEGVDDFQVGDAVMALAFGAFGSKVVTRAVMAAAKPASLTFEAAATIPLVFATAQYGLIDLARLAPGERVLIHAAAGGVGLAAIQVARRAGATIFATAGNPEKRAHLAALGISAIFDSRSLEFADEVMAATNGEGVDVVLNSLAGEAIRKGLSILRPYGRFIELGKRDIHADSSIGLLPFDRSLTFSSVALDRMFTDRPEVLGRILRNIVSLMEQGELTPIPFTAFDLSQAEQTFRTLGQARHIGKFVLTVHEPAYQVAADSSRPLCRTDATYVISGGLGGFGLAVAQWLAKNGATHLVLMSRSGIASPDNEAALARLRELPTQSLIYKGDVGSEADVQRMLAEIRETLPPLRGVVHAAMVLDDVPLGQLTPERLNAVLEPKVGGSWNLHQLTRTDDLDFFVMFSSFSSIIGTKGQGNYAAANAFLDMLAPYRRSLGLPALTINWGGLTDVGYVARHQEVAQYLHRHGTEDFTSTEALEVLEQALRHGVSQLMVARLDWARWSAIESKAFKKSKRLAHFAAAEQVALRDVTGDLATLRRTLAAAVPEQRPGLLEIYVVERVAKVLGTSPARVAANEPLTQMGVDSLMAVELQTIVERDTGVQVPLDWLLEGIAIRQLTTRLLDRLEFEPDTSASAREDDAVTPLVSAPAVVVPTIVAAPAATALRDRSRKVRDAVVSTSSDTSADALPDVAELTPRQEVSRVVETPIAPAARDDINYRSLDYSRWSSLQKLTQRGVAALFRVVTSVQIEGVENIPRSGPVIMAANHLSMLDVPLIFTVLPRRTVCLAADRLRRSPFIRWFLDVGNTIYVHRGEADQDALGKALMVLQAGGILGIAPEGTRSRTGGLLRGQAGAAHLATESQAPILPVVAFGHERLWYNLRRLRRTRVCVQIGPPITVAPGAKTAAKLQSDTEYLMRTLAAMLPPEYRGVYASAADAQKQPLTTA
jgi:1-acyl-sn-glycerol-3-phosphate acyltransferase